MCDNKVDHEGRGHTFAHENKTWQIGTYQCESYNYKLLELMLQGLYGYKIRHREKNRENVKNQITLPSPSLPYHSLNKSWFMLCFCLHF